MKAIKEDPKRVPLKRTSSGHLEKPGTTNSGEFQMPTKAVLELALMEPEEFQATWDGVYANIWNQADALRERGDYEKALDGYRKAQSLVKEAAEKGVDEDVILLREAFLHYMIIQCYANIHQEPNLVMREFHNFGVTLYCFIQLVLKDFPESDDVVEQLDDLYKQDNYVSVSRIQRCLNIFYRNRADQLDDKQLEITWKCAYAITRFAGSIQDFFIKSTSLVDIGKQYYGVCDQASQIAIASSNSIDPAIIQSNESLKTLKRLTDEWLDGYTEFLQDELNHILGAEEDEDEKERKKKARRESTMNLAEAKYLSDHIDTNDPVVKKGLEFALQNMIRRTFEYMFRGEMKYEDGVSKLNEIIERCEQYGFKNLTIQAYVFLCRIALKEEEIEDAKSALTELRSLELQPVDKIGAESSNHERWYALLDAEIQMYQYQDKDDIKKNRDETRKSIVDTGLDLDSFKPYLQFIELEKIEEIFKRYQSDTKEKLPKLSFKPLDAKIYHVLGLVALEKAKIFGREFNSLTEDDEEKTIAGKELQKAFEDAETYLCEAYANLANMDYKGTYLKNKIGASCEEMMALNKEILGDTKRDADQSALERAEGDNPSFDMESFVKDNQVKKSADLIYDVISNYDIALPDNEFEVLSGGLQKIFQKMDSTVCSTHIIEGEGVDERHKEAIANFKNSVGSENMKERTYYYNTPDGKIIEVFCMDKDKERYVLLEVDIKLTGNARELVGEILNGIKYFLRLKDSVQKLEKAEDNDKEPLKEEYLFNLNELGISLMRQHPPTVRHSEDVGKMARLAAIKINKVYGSNLNPTIAEYAGKTHDIGKIFSSATFVLGAPRLLQKFEYQEIQQHVVKGAKVLLHLKAFKHVPELVQLVAPHHVKYANDFGYPFKAPGSQIITMPSQINKEFDIKPGDPNYLDGKMSKEEALLARMISLIDVVSAVRSWDRFYRKGPEPLDDFIKSIISRTGSDYDPQAVVLLFQIFNEGSVNDIIAFNEEDREYLLRINGPKKAYPWSKVYEFFDINRGELEKVCKVPLDYALGVLAADSANEFTLTDKAVGRLVCESMIRAMGDRDEAVDLYKKEVRGEFGSKFNGWFDD